MRSTAISLSLKSFFGKMVRIALSQKLGLPTNSILSVASDRHVSRVMCDNDILNRIIHKVT